MKECKFIPIDNSEPQTRRTQSKITPECALEILRQGNDRFSNKLTIRRDLMWQVEATSCDQYPFAIILSCIDSRVPTELIFDQGIGDIFSVSIPGNFVNSDILGSIEFAYTVGVRLILVLGHTKCGAIKAAIQECDKDKKSNQECNHILPMVENLCPAVKAANKGKDKIDFTNQVIRKNVELSIDKIRKESLCVKDAEQKQELAIMGGIYDIDTGIVSFFNHPE